MLENMKLVSNPLTIIAMFAGLAEIAGTVTAGKISGPQQAVFVWFLMGFPVLLVVLFFLTLNFNPKVLYAPSDFRDEENFLTTLNNRSELAGSFDKLTEQLELAKKEIVGEAKKEGRAAGAAETGKLAKIISEQIEIIRGQIDSARESAEELTAPISDGSLPRSKLQAQILVFLSTEPEGASLSKIAQNMPMSPEATERALRKLSNRNVIEQTTTDPPRFRLVRR